MSKYFYHGIRNGLVAPDTVIDIFKSGGIKSRRLQRISYKAGFNGPDYVSICRKEADTEYDEVKNNAFKNYILDSFCFIISDDIPAVKCDYVPETQEWDRFQLYKFMNEHPDIRITDMFDEWQVKDEIKFSNIIGIGIPTNWISKMHNAGFTNIRALVSKIVTLASEYQLDIVDSSVPNFIELYEKEKKNKINLK